MKKTIAVIGCGVIGSRLAEEAEENLSRYIGRIVLFDADSGRMKDLASRLASSGEASGLEEAIDAADLIVEAASPAVSRELLKMAVEKGKDIMLMSIGGVLGKEDLLDKAREKGVRVLLPSGAVCGIDGVKAAKIAGIESATLTTRKSPKSIKGAPYLEANKIDVDSVAGETVVFEGTALEAVKGFPKNINVSAILSLAGVGPERTKVRIIISPEYTRNTHEIEVEGSSGRLTMRAENVPSPDNPKTSYLAALAAITSLRQYFDTVRIGS